MTETVTGLPRRLFIDKQHPAVYQAQLEWAAAVRAAAEEAGLGRTLVELVNVRVSQLNRCAYCLDMHARRALELGETPQRLAVLPAWRDTTLFTDKERAALTLAESLTVLPDAVAQNHDYEEAAAILTAEELSAVAWVAIAIGAFNRVSIVSRHPVKPRGEVPEEEPEQHGDGL